MSGEGVMPMQTRSALAVALSAAASCMLSWCAHAAPIGGPARAPTYTEARKVTDAIVKVIDGTNIWHKKTRLQRIKAAGEAAALQLEAERIFGHVLGPFGRCTQAASTLSLYVEGLNKFSDAADGTRVISEAQDLFDPLRWAVLLGDQYRQCRELIETLDAKRR